VKAGETSQCTIVKSDDIHAKYPQTMKQLYVTAVEDTDYYCDRFPGPVHTRDEATIAKRSETPICPATRPIGAASLSFDGVIEVLLPPIENMPVTPKKSDPEAHI
jgi:hypothetical protein